MAVVARVDPKTVFSADEWRRLTSRSSLRGMWLVAHAWGTIAAVIALVTLWPNPLTWLIAVMVVGTRQLGLAILMHEAAHGGLHNNKTVNEWVGQWLCAVPVGADLAQLPLVSSAAPQIYPVARGPRFVAVGAVSDQQGKPHPQGDPRSHRANVCEAAAAVVPVAVQARQGR
jgi:hypothetical protein